jgi:ferredoxin
VTDVAVIDTAGLDALIAVLREDGYRVLGPTWRDGAVVYADVRSVDDLPTGVVDEQGPGRYRAHRVDGDERRFAYTVAADTWKRHLHPPRAVQWRAERLDGELRVNPVTTEAARLALLGVRACELAALAILDRVLLAPPYPDPDYAARRRDAFVVAVACTKAGGTCFCESWGTDPTPRSGFDLLLVERAGRYAVQAGTSRGSRVLAAVPHRAAEPDDVAPTAAPVMGRHLDTSDLPARLGRALEHPRWDDVAERCLACGGCTAVCPTCFCTTAEEHTAFDTTVAEHARRWDSCFTLEFSFLNGGSVRASKRARYRQWATHKLATWVEQFGTPGCVGCGRCITWCPAGIDLTEEVAVIAGEAT